MSSLGAIRSKDVAILVPSWDGYQDAWRPFFECFFKYWPDCPYPVYLGSNHLSYEDDRVSSILIGNDIDYTTNLLTMLEQINQNWIILWIEDFILTELVSTSKICELIDLAQKSQVGHLRLCRRRYSTVFSAAASIVDNAEKKLSEIPKGTMYRVGINLGLWKKNTLCKLLRPGETAWDIERKGTARSFDLEDGFYCVLADKPPFSIVNGILRGKWTREAVALLRQEGLQDCLGERPVQTLWSNLYIKTYTRARYLYFKALLKLTRGLRCV